MIRDTEQRKKKEKEKIEQKEREVVGQATSPASVIYAWHLEAI